MLGHPLVTNVWLNQSLMNVGQSSCVREEVMYLLSHQGATFDNDYGKTTIQQQRRTV